MKVGTIFYVWAGPPCPVERPWKFVDERSPSFESRAAFHRDFNQIKYVIRYVLTYSLGNIIIVFGTLIKRIWLFSFLCTV